jgi:hypothetical protein
LMIQAIVDAVRGHKFLAPYSMPLIKGCTRCSLMMGPVKMFMLIGFALKVVLLPSHQISLRLGCKMTRKGLLRGELAMDLEEEAIQENLQDRARASSR